MVGTGSGSQWSSVFPLVAVPALRWNSLQVRGPWTERKDMSLEGPPASFAPAGPPPAAAREVEKQISAGFGQLMGKRKRGHGLLGHPIYLAKEPNFLPSS